MRVRAPGKLFLCGEYAVLEGAPAVVLAVDRYVEVRRAARGPTPPLVADARAAAARHLGVSPARGHWRADSRALRSGRRKLGLGSSAAVTVASVAAVFHEAGLDVRDRATRVRMWEVAREVHDAHQGEKGSGADLAASLSGGWTLFRPGPRPALAAWQPPEGVRFLFLWSGIESSTAALVRTVRALRDDDPALYGAILDDLGDAARRVARCDGLDWDRLSTALHEAGMGMFALGFRAGAGIVTPRVALLSLLAARHGGVAKPSGAGGGDFVVAAFPPGAPVDRFLRRARASGFKEFSLSPCPLGVHVIEP